MDTPRRRPGNRSRSAPRGSDHCRAPRVGAFVGLDLFQDPSLFAREWPKLLRAQALETYGRRVEDKTDERRQRALLSDLVRAAPDRKESRRASLLRGLA